MTTKDRRFWATKWLLLPTWLAWLARSALLSAAGRSNSYPNSIVRSASSSVLCGKEKVETHRMIANRQSSRLCQLQCQPFKLTQAYINDFPLFSRLRQDPLDLSFWSFLTFFAKWYRRRWEASSVKISQKTSKEKLVKCATEVARLHKVSIQSCTQNQPSPKVQSRSGDWI